MKRVLVTGGAGYIGSHVVRELVTRGYDPFVVDNLSTGHRWAVPEERLVACDIVEFDRIQRLLREHDVSAVLHFAGLIIAPESVAQPYRYYRNNVADSLELLRAVIGAGVKHFIFSSSAAVYGDPNDVPIPETAAIAPINPYGQTKAMIEQALADFSIAHELNHVCLRYFNVAGADPAGGIGEAHDPETHLIPLALRTALGQREAFNIYGTDFPTPDGTCIRDYIHVTDLVEAHVLALEYLLQGGPSDVFNCGYGRGFSVREVVDAVRRSTSSDFRVVEADRRPGDPAELVAGTDKIRRVLSWRPRHDDLDSIIASALRWERSRVR